MHKYTLFTLIFLVNGLHAQRKFAIEGTIKDYYGSSLTLELVNNGFAIGGNDQKVPVTEKNDLDYIKGEFEMDAAGFVGFFHYGTSKYVRYWVSPEGTNGLNIDWENPRVDPTFYGVTKNENTLLQKLDLGREKYQKPKVGYSRTTIKNLRESEMTLLKEAFSLGNLSSEFFNVMKADIKYFWLALSEEKAIKFENALDQPDLDDPTVWRTPYYLKYLSLYFSRKNSAFDLVTKYENISLSLKGKQIHEALWVYDLFEESSKEVVDYDIIQAQALFQKSFKNTPFIPKAAENIALIEDEYKVRNTKITDDMVIVNGTMDFQLMLDKFKGKVIYLDIWATWCAPCIVEMRPRYKDPLTEFIKDKDIKVIYFSVDIDPYAEKWKKKVKDLRLNSFNIRFPDYKSSKAFDFLGMSEDVRYYIPRYYIIDKNGKLVNDNAPRPSDGEKLYAELSKYL
ncbi:TlpA family protein disulfide reductase [Roseivirga misakiensis]|uniref:Thioredoxin domain-containing protein n=1 Tax=Roseivirga misakiensis TaxID=1563681 RepID=A0A1E5T6M9_9BACT|nr:TlpA disulfide reductase family protein [Roseivirga misakiensis]OEK07020.1 hypothetical protein BFP71_05015 [Roseivirga misakiensis]